MLHFSSRLSPILLLEVRAGIMDTKVELDVIGIMSMGRKEAGELGGHTPMKEQVPSHAALAILVITLKVISHTEGYRSRRKTEQTTEQYTFTIHVIITFPNPLCAPSSPCSSILGLSFI